MTENPEPARAEPPNEPLQAGCNAGQVGPDSHLTLHYRLSLLADNAEVVSTFGGRPATLQLGRGQLAQPLEQLLIGLPEGAQQRFELNADGAYGQRNGQLVQTFSRAVFDANTSRSDGEFMPGDVVDFNGQSGERVAGVVKAIDADHVLVDFNHPLAGQEILFEVHLIGVL